MQFMLMVYKNDARFAQMPEAEKRRISDACDTWGDELKQTGHLQEMTRLHNTASAATVRKSGERFLVTDGPFAETKEVFGGFAILECRDRAEAVELAKTFPGVEAGFAVEVRPVFTSKEDQPCWRQT
jgi:hypothetical protein